jgi:hypothetical protein
MQHRPALASALQLHGGCGRPRRQLPRPPARCVAATRALHTGEDGSLPSSSDSAAAPPPWAPIAEPRQPESRWVQTRSGMPMFSPPVAPNPCSNCAGTGKTCCETCRCAGAAASSYRGWRRRRRRRVALNAPISLDRRSPTLPSASLFCRGKGRLNYRGAAMLPQGAWPAWCPNCRASGKWFCPKCMGTGERREPIGFRIEGAAANGKG